MPNLKKSEAFLKPSPRENVNENQDNFFEIEVQILQEKYSH